MLAVLYCLCFGTASSTKQVEGRWKRLDYQSKRFLLLLGTSLSFLVFLFAHILSKILKIGIS